MTPTSGRRYLLDTNIIIALLGGDEAVRAHFNKAPQVLVPAIAIGELFFGAAKSGRPVENAATVEQFAAGSVVLPVDVAVAGEYGRLRQHLKTKGRPIPENDIWIAATASAHKLILVSRDRHFREIDELEIDDWTSSR